MNTAMQRRSDVKATTRRCDRATKGNAARARFRRQGAVLLEVIIALAILILGMAAVGMQVNVGLKVATDTQVATRAVQLADSKWSEMDAGVLDWNPSEEMEGDFGIQYPGWAWRMYVDPTDTPDLNMVTLEILYKPGVRFREELPTYEDMIVVHTSYSLRATPARVNLADFGVDLSTLEGSSASTPATGDGGSTPGSGDRGGTGSGSLADLLGRLMELLPQGFDPMNIRPDFVKDIPPENIPEIMTILQQLLGPGGALLGGMQGGLSELMEQVDRKGGGKGSDGGQEGADGGGTYGPSPTDNPPDGGSDVGGRRGGRRGSDGVGRRPGRGGDGAGGGDADGGNGSGDAPIPQRRGDGGRLGDDSGTDTGDAPRFPLRRGGERGGDADGFGGRAPAGPRGAFGRGGRDSVNRSGGRDDSGLRSGRDGGFGRRGEFGQPGSPDSGSSRFGGEGGSELGRSGGESRSGFRGSRFGSRSTDGVRGGGTRSGGSGRAGLSDPYRVPTEEDLLGGRSGVRRR